MKIYCSKLSSFNMHKKRVIYFLNSKPINILTIIKNKASDTFWSNILFYLSSMDVFVILNKFKTDFQSDDLYSILIKLIKLRYINYWKKRIKTKLIWWTSFSYVHFFIVSIVPFFSSIYLIISQSKNNLIWKNYLQNALTTSYFLS